MRKITSAVLVCLLLASTGGVIAASDGGSSSGGHAAKAVYGLKTCSDLTRANRSYMKAVRKRHQRLERQLRGRARRIVARQNRIERLLLQANQRKAEKACRKNGGQ